MVEDTPRQHRLLRVLKISPPLCQPVDTYDQQHGRVRHQSRVHRFVHIAPGLRSLSVTYTWMDTRTRTAGTFQSPSTFANTYTDTFSTLKCIYGDTQLLCATQNRHGAMAKLLIEKGAEFSVQGSLRMTPLRWAALNGHEAIAKLLVEKGANLSVHDNNGGMPLH